MAGVAAAGEGAGGHADGDFDIITWTHQEYMRDGADIPVRREAATRSVMQRYHRWRATNREAGRVVRIVSADVKHDTVVPAGVPGGWHPQSFCALVVKYRGDAIIPEEYR